MSDARLREAERMAHDDPSARSRVLSGLLRTGRVTRGQLEVRSALGEEDAALAIGVAPGVWVQDDAPGAEWLARALDFLSLMHASLSIVRHTAAAFEQAMSPGSERWKSVNWSKIDENEDPRQSGFIALRLRGVLAPHVQPEASQRTRGAGLSFDAFEIGARELAYRRAYRTLHRLAELPDGAAVRGVAEAAVFLTACWLDGQRVIPLGQWIDANAAGTVAAEVRATYENAALYWIVGALRIGDGLEAGPWLRRQVQSAATYCPGGALEIRDMLRAVIGARPRLDGRDVFEVL